jgi:integrase
MILCPLSSGLVFRRHSNSATAPRRATAPTLIVPKLKGTEIAVEALREHLTIQRERQRLLGDAYTKHDLVCCREDGNIWKPDSFTDSYFRFTRKIGIKLRFHDLRHSHASQLLRQGVSAKVVSERLGHSSIGITLDIYSHVLPGMQKEAAAKINSAFKIAVEKLRRPIA